MYDWLKKSMVSQATAQHRNEVQVVYHLCGKTGSSTVCTNGKQKSPIKNYVQDWRVPFA